MDVAGPLRARTGQATSAVLARDWQVRLEMLIEAFGPDRCMFASNYPADRSVGSYGVVWNAFKRFAARYGPAEQDRLFRGTASETYCIDPNKPEQAQGPRPDG